MKKEHIVIMTKEEAFWDTVKKNTERELEEAEKAAKFHREVLKMANNKILLQKRK